MESFSQIARQSLKTKPTALDLEARIPKAETVREFVFGLDLGFSADYSAMIGIDRVQQPDSPAIQNVVFAQRWPLKTPHHAVLLQVDRILARLPKRPTQPTLVVDATGVGAPIFVDMRRDQRKGKYGNTRLLGVTITAGQKGKPPTQDERGVYHASKAELVGCALAMFGSDRLRIARSLPLAGVLHRELQVFQVKLSQSRVETYEAAKSSDHDDCVMALCLATWYCDRRRSIGIHIGESNAPNPTGGAGRNPFFL